MSFGFIDKSGSKAIPAVFYEARDFRGGFAAVKTNDSQVGFIDPSGKFFAVKDADEVGDFSCSLARFRVGRLFGFVDGTGRVAVKPRYQEAKAFEAGVSAVRRDGKWGVIDTSGKAIVPCSYEWVNVYAGAMIYCGSSKGEACFDLEGRKVWPRKER